MLPPKSNDERGQDACSAFESSTPEARDRPARTVASGWSFSGGWGGAS